MSAVTTHVLDTARGRPGTEIAVTLEALDGPHRTLIAEGRTDGDGRIAALGPEQLASGDYQLTFDTGEYFARTGTETFYPLVQVRFRLADPEQHYHVPLLLSPFSYSTYRGS